MYTDDDLNLAVKEKVFTQSMVDEFRHLVSQSKNTPYADEENFKLISGFNDIFVVIAIGLFLFSSVWLLQKVNMTFAYVIFTALAWVLAEFFVRKRKMALPAIVLLIAFIGGITGLGGELFSSLGNEINFTIASALAVVGAIAHWFRFKVPITIAAGTASVIGLVLSALATIIPSIKDWIMPLLIISGVLVFLYAMYWDSGDTQRVKYNSDVAFWLHLLAAPLIIHPIFKSLGVFDGYNSVFNIVVIIAVYLLVTIISLSIDRRALMVSALAYVVYAVSTLFKSGGVGYSLAFSGMFMGASLLVLSIYWHSVRKFLLSILPNSMRQHLP